MCLEEAGDRVAFVQLNAELRNAQLEMLSAQCATDHLRLRFSAEDIARHGQRDLLRKAWASASALYEYYNKIVKQVPAPEAIDKPGVFSLNEAKTEEAIASVADYLRTQRDHFRRDGVPLDRELRQAMEPFFSPSLLHQVRTVNLNGKQIPNPPFYSEAQEMGFKNLPNMPLMASVTFEEILVFHSEITSRALFHALVHAVQFEVLGLDRYSELFVRAFLRTRSYFSVPLEAHAFQLESRFAENPAEPFSVVAEVRQKTNQGRY